MVHQFWHLSEAGENNSGLACTDDGLVLGRTPLMERRGGRFAVRERGEVEQLLRSAYLIDTVEERVIGGLTIVAAALNANDPCLARIAAVHLRMPDLLGPLARTRMEVEDARIKSASLNSHLRGREIAKAGPDDPKHPGWPAGTEGGRGGKFRPKDGSDALIAEQVKERIKRIAMRRALRTEALAVLRLVAEAAANAIPGVGFVADAAMLIDLAATISELRKLKIDADAAIDFVKHGPYSLEELQVSSSEYEEFSSYDAFVKELTVDAMNKRFGPAGAGNQYHHIVT